MATRSQSSPQSRAETEPEFVPLQRAPNVLDLIGNTPLLEITRLTDGIIPRAVRIFAKLEGFNPGGSVKDRAARSMIMRGIESGELRPGKIILDSTSGNTGIALAMVGAVLGYPVELVMASNVSRERKRIIEAYGAKIIFSDPMELSDGAIRLCRKIYAENPERYFKPDQYNNEANSLAHFETTGPEIWHQTEGRVTHFLAAIGTSGTVMGTGTISEIEKSRHQGDRGRARRSDARPRRTQAHGVVDRAGHLSRNGARLENPDRDRGRVRDGLHARADRGDGGRAIVGRRDARRDEDWRARFAREPSSRFFPTSATNIYPPICGSDGSNGGRNNGENA